LCGVDVFDNNTRSRYNNTSTYTYIIIIIIINIHNTTLVISGLTSFRSEDSKRHDIPYTQAGEIDLHLYTITVHVFCYYNTIARPASQMRIIITTTVSYFLSTINILLLYRGIYIRLWGRLEILFGPRLVRCRRDRFQQEEWSTAFCDLSSKTYNFRTRPPSVTTVV